VRTSSGDASSPEGERDASVALIPVTVWFGFKTEGDASSPPLPSDEASLLPKAN
jgi:hypothetical protein